jgi:transcriptional regulator with XRE-family HTH domain
MRDQDIYRLIGRRLRARRRLLEMTQGDVASRCGLTFQQIQKYEAGLIAMPIARLIAIADALQAPVADFIQGLPAGPQADAANWRVVDGPRELLA